MIPKADSQQNGSDRHGQLRNPIEFLSEKNESLKKEITNYLIDGNDKEVINKKINDNYEKIIR